MTDTRQPWEVEWSVRLGFCANYLDMSETTGTARARMTLVYSDDLDGWCDNHIKVQLVKCAAMVEDHGPPSALARAAVRGVTDRLRDAGRFDAVLDRALLTERN